MPYVITLSEFNGDYWEDIETFFFHSREKAERRVAEWKLEYKSDGWRKFSYDLHEIKFEDNEKGV